MAAGCLQPQEPVQAPTIYNTRHVATNGEVYPPWVATPAPTEKNPRLKNYLAMASPSEAEWPLFEVWSRQPLDETRDVLTALSLIRESWIINVSADGANEHKEDRTGTWMANFRPKLVFREAYTVGREKRWAWIFQGEARPFGNGSPLGPGLAILTDEEYHVLAFKQAASPQSAIVTRQGENGDLTATWTTWQSKGIEAIFARSEIEFR